MRAVLVALITPLTQNIPCLESSRIFIPRKTSARKTQRSITDVQGVSASFTVL